MAQLNLELVRLKWPADWMEILGRQAPLMVEIGFGNGVFLLDQAQRRPELNFLGVEIAAPSMRRASERIRNAQVDNVRLIRAKAQSVLQLLFSPTSIQGVTINFPDPWPKAGHTGRRLISASFLALLASRMVPGAGLDIATDHEEYGQWIAQLLMASPYFTSRISASYTLEDDGRTRTKYEQKGLSAGSTCFYFKWRRNSASAPEGFEVAQELAMPHAVVRCPLTLQEIAAAFEPREFSADGVTLRFIDLYQSLRRPSLVVDTYIAEEALDQRLMLEIHHRPDRDYMIRLYATGFPRATAGVHAAVARLADWLCGLDDEAAVLRHNLREAPAAGTGKQT